ncbi:MAG: rod shape-determining protein MreC [Elusimicrobia bacterium RIFCSPLOWO2_02_FULL_61_11]|nr:MAG: rod shape-determining protein MreC [Elusimicrobia bacterium RIFCSPLOWO2_02_FULL_61_11]
MSREKDAANYAIVFFAVLSVLLLIFPASRIAHTARIVASYSLYPSLHYGARYGHFVRNVPANFVALLETDQENRTLREKVRDLEIRLLNASASVAENERLSKELKLSRSLPWAGSWARIINKTPADWYGSFFINKGSDDGVEVNDTVLGMQDDKAGLAGRVFEVYPKFSKVLLITNSAASAVCSIAPSGLEALVEGKGTWLLKVNYVPEQSELTEGAQITTAAGGLLFPAGVPVGKVTKVYPRESFMNFITADVTPAVDVNTLKEVFVVRRHLQREIIAAAGAER